MERDDVTTDEDEVATLLPGATPHEPSDRFNLVYAVFFLLGLGSLLPWNFFITAKQYFQYKLRNTTLAEDADYNDPTRQTNLQIMFESYLAIVSTLFNLLFNFITAALVRKISLKTRMLTSVTVIVIMFAVTECLVLINTDTWQRSFFIITMAIVAVLNACSSVFGASLFGLAGLFPIRYMQAAMGGQSLGGTFAALASILSLSAGKNPVQSAFGFFLSAGAVTIFTGIGYICLYHLDFSKYYIAMQEDAQRSINEEIPTVTTNEAEHGCSYFTIIFKQIWVEAVSVCVVFMVTLSCFPAVVSAVSSSDEKPNPWTDTYFTPVVCFLLFNIGDLAGRFTAGILSWPRSNHRGCLLALTWMRVVFIPLFLLCNVQPRYHIPVRFDNDAYPIVFVLLLGVTNGHLGTLCMMYGPTRVVPVTEYAESSGALMSVALTVGLSVGSFISMGLLKLL